VDGDKSDNKNNKNLLIFQKDMIFNSTSNMVETSTAFMTTLNHSSFVALVAITTALIQTNISQ
jgi:hypothetical protein